MKKFLQTYKNPNEDRFNYPLINKEYDDSLVDNIINCCKSLEVLDSVTFIGYDHITDEASINTSEYIDAKSRQRPKKSDVTRYMYIRDSRYNELRLKFYIECNGESKYINKKLLIPIPDEDGYYHIKGNKYLLLYQIVDSASYTTKSSVVLKSMMPVILKMKHHNADSTNGDNYEAPIYTISIFKKDINVLIFYLARFGLTETLEYFSADSSISFKDKIGDTEKFMYFGINSKLFIQVDKFLFEKFTYLKSMVFMLLDLMTNRMTMDNLYNKDFWIEELGSYGTLNKNSQYEKGLNTMIFFDRIIDHTTKKILKLDEVNKVDTYAIVRWLVQNFNELRKKDVMDLANKRLRCNEYIASLLTKTFSERINRIIALGQKATLKNIEDLFKFPGDLILSQLHKSGLLRYDDRVNDMDLFGKLKITFKGPNSLGGNNDNNISTRYRGLSPSYIGRLDINVCGTSDPGTSAILTPFCKTDGLYFDGSHEPETFKYEFDKAISDYYRSDDCLNIAPSFNSLKEYYDFSLKAMELKKNITVSKKSRYSDGDMYIIDIET